MRRGRGGGGECTHIYSSGCCSSTPLFKNPGSAYVEKPRSGKTSWVERLYSGEANHERQKKNPGTNPENYALANQSCLSLHSRLFQFCLFPITCLVTLNTLPVSLHIPVLLCHPCAIGPFVPWMSLYFPFVKGTTWRKVLKEKESVKHNTPFQILKGQVCYEIYRTQVWNSLAS